MQYYVPSEQTVLNELSYKKQVQLHRTVIAAVAFFTLTDRASAIHPVIYMVANPIRGHKEVRRSMGHIMVTARY